MDHYEYAKYLPLFYKGFTGFYNTTYYISQDGVTWDKESRLNSSLNDADPYYNITSGWTDGKGTPHIGMPFECLDHRDCFVKHFFLHALPEELSFFTGF